MFFFLELQQEVGRLSANNSIGICTDPCVCNEHDPIHLPCLNMNMQLLNGVPCPVFVFPCSPFGLISCANSYV